MSLGSFFRTIVDKASLIKLDESVSLKWASEESYWYYEGDHTMRVYWQHREPGHLAIIFKKDTRWESPFQEETVTQERMLSIANRISKYLLTQGFQSRIEIL